MRAALALLWLLAAAPAAALEVPPAAPVVDLAGMLAPDTVRELHQRLIEYEARTGHQLAVLIIPSLEGEPVEDYSLRVAETWALGSRERDDGLLLLIAVADRKARIEVGHGLEGAITDALSSRVIRETLAPALGRGDADSGVRDSLEILMRAAQGENVGSRSAERSPQLPSLLVVLLWVGFLMIAIQLERARSGALQGHHRWGSRRRSRDHVWIEPAGWGGSFGGMGQRGGGFGGGGFGGGGFGAGGGSFGGGGASGSW